MYFEVLNARGGGYYWHIVGGNNEIMAASQVYRTKSAALHAVGVVQANAYGAAVYDRTS